MIRPRVDRKVAYVVTAILLVAFGSGYAVAAGLTITNGLGENGSGVYHTTTAAPGWWSEFSAGGTTTPVGLGALSGTVGLPTVLAGVSTPYAVNAPTPGDIATFWKLQETTGASLNTELALIFQVTTGPGAGTLTTITLYVETQSSAPGATLTFTMYFDLGSGSLGPIVQSVVVIWQQCSAVGTCP